MRVITGSARGMALKAPKGMDTRPTMDQVKEGIFSAIQFEVEGRRVLDLFAGSGQMGIEALSRGAKSAVFVDSRDDACKVVRENLAKTRLEGLGKVVRLDYLSYLHSCRETFDLIFLDPPYAEVFLENSLKTISQIDILSDSGIIITERPFGKELPAIVPGLVRYRDYRYGRNDLSQRNPAGGSMSKAIYPGSFDPVTNGHLNIIERAAKTFDELIVCVMINAEKHPVFSSEERVELIRRVTKHIPNVTVTQSSGLLAEFAREQNCGVVVKGLRALSDFEHEFQMALINHKLNPSLDTMFLTTEHQFMYLSSSIVKEMAHYGADLHGFVPDAIIDDVTARMTGKNKGGL